MSAQTVSAAEIFFSTRLKDAGTSRRVVVEVVVPEAVGVDRRLAYLGAAFDLAQGQATERALGDDLGCVTLRLHAERGPVEIPAGETLRVEGKALAVDNTVVLTEARALDSSGGEVGRSSACFLVHGPAASQRVPPHTVVPFAQRSGDLEAEMGLQWAKTTGGRWEAGADLGNPNGVVHGGAQLTAMACAALRGASRLDLKLRWITLVFMRPALLHTDMSLETHLRIGRSAGGVCVNLMDDSSRVCTQADIGLA